MGIEKNRKFKEKWKIKYFCDYMSSAIYCLICNEKIACIKEYNIKRHYSTRHKDNYDIYIGEARKKSLQP